MFLVNPLNGSGSEVSGGPEVPRVQLGGLYVEPGTYSVALTCESRGWDPAAGERITTLKTFAPVEYTITGPAPTPDVSPTVVSRGSNFTVGDGGGCGISAMTSVSVSAEHESGTYQLSGFAYVPVASGRWGPVGFNVPQGAPTGNYRILAYCSDPVGNPQNPSNYWELGGVWYSPFATVTVT